ncbi:MAG: hypothetical protein B6245_23355 [Desulfobacteraceae bacterium 4572_88]|nr:MAG: hypothetical protein B6245_23355 [Desulfobacteraceae bacterium 4572_88]
MGGAFIAIADDATAASWNPGGLVQLERPETSAVYGCLHRTEDRHFRGHPEAEGSGSSDYSNLNYLSIAYPFEINKPKLTDDKMVQSGPRRNMIVSLNYQQLYDFNRDWSFSLNGNDPYYTAPIRTDYEQKGALYALGLAYCVQVTIDFSIGITLNCWGDFLSENQWEKRYHRKEEKVQGSFVTERKEEYDFEGWNANIGFLWKLSRRWTLGGVFKAPFTGDIERVYTERRTFISLYPSTDDYDSVSKEKHQEKLYMPISYGIGAAYRHSDNFTVSADVYRTHWDDFELKDERGIRISPITGDHTDRSDIDPTVQFRMGAEYLHVGERFIVPFRAGIFYDPAPAKGSPDDYYGVSIGTGLVYEPRERWGLCERLVFDIAWQFRFGEDVGRHNLPETFGFSQDVYEHTVYTSLIVHF